MSMKQAGGNRKPGGSSGSAAAASGAGGGGGAGGRQSLGRWVLRQICDSCPQFTSVHVDSARFAVYVGKKIQCKQMPYSCMQICLKNLEMLGY